MTSQPASYPAAPPAPGFPQPLDQVPLEARVPERFGWLAGAAAIAAAVVAVSSFSVLLGHGKVKDETVGMAVGGVIGAIFFAWYEVWRRLRRTVLVPRGQAIGVYRRGALAVVIGQGSMAPYALHPLNTIRYLLVPVLLGPVLFLGGLASALSSGKLESFLMTLGGAYVCAIGASLVWTRIVCKHFYIPKDGGREEVIFTRQDLKRLLGG